MAGETAGFFKRFFYHPNFNVVAGVFGIVGTILAVYFYRASIQKPDLSYYVSPTRNPIVQKGNLDNFSVTFQGTPINGDLSTAEIQIWNQGNAPIFSNDILVPVTIRLTNGETIYQASATTTRDVIGFNWLSPTNHPTDKLEFNWKILEQNDGIKLQIIYGGDVSSVFDVKGTIVNQNHIWLKKFSNEPLIEFHTVVTAGFVILILIWFMFIFPRIREKEFRRIDLFYMFVFMLIDLMVVVYFAHRVLTLSYSKPPFGF